jgi:hypothetical protein
MQHLIRPCRKLSLLRVIALVLALLLPMGLAGGSAMAEESTSAAVNSQLTTAFTYQGQLKRDGGAFSGTCAFQFSLWDADVEGTQQGDVQSIADVAVAEGLFTVQLDFGNQFTGDARWLAVQVLCDGDAEYTTLTPRVLLTAAPYALGLMPGAEIQGAIASTAGVLKVVNHAEGTAILGLAAPSAGVTYGVLGNAFSPNGYGVSGYGSNGAVGVYGRADNGGTGVFGNSPGGTGVSGTSGDWIGVYGESANFQGVRGVAHNVNHGAVVGEHRGGGFGVFGTSDNGAGVVGTSKVWVGTYGESVEQAGTWGKSTNGIGAYGESANSFGVKGLGRSAAGVLGESTEHVGVWGMGHHPHHAGVLGTHDGGGAGVVGTSPAGDGVFGTTAAGNKAGVAGINTGNGNGVYGRSDGGGFAGFFEGSVGSRTVHILGGADLAEWYNITGIAEPGTLMVIDPENPGQLMPSSRAYDTRVAGVVSGAGGVNPGLTLQQEGVLDGDTQVAIAGRVYVHAEALSAPIEPGDLLTTSDIPGHAMKVTDRDLAYGAVIGKAMTGLDEGTGLVLVLVNLQ